MNDETLLAEELGAEKERNKKLEKKLDRANYQINQLQCSIAWKKVFYAASGIVLGLGIAVGGAWLCYKGLTREATNRCYIVQGRQAVDVYKVHRIVNWGTDTDLGFSTDLDKAREIARKQGCNTPEAMKE